MPDRRARVDVDEHAAFARDARTTSAAGCTVPTSWFASCTLTSAVSLADRGGDLRRVEPADPVDADDRAFDLRAFERVAHARVLDRGRHDVPASAGPCDAPQTAVLTASVPDDVNTTSRGRAPTKRGDLLACVFERDARRASFGVQAAGIAGVLAQEREHRVERGRAQRR